MHTQDVNHWPALLAGLTDELVKQGSIRGALRSGMWTPAVYVEAQQRQMDSFYNTNGCVWVYVYHTCMHALF